jgi:CDP-4-dehydro-6-deoxyglucose reductase
MSHTVPLSRVARLVGVTRGALQEKIRHGEIDSFDGYVTVEELLRVFPDTQLEDYGELEHVNQIKERAFGKRVYERALPDKEVLASRLHQASKELGEARALLSHYDAVLKLLDVRFDDLKQETGASLRGAVDQVRAWLARELSGAPEQTRAIQAVLAQESLLRVMSAHVHIQPGGSEFFDEGADTILEAGLHAGIALNYGCSNGNCGLCRARLVSGEIRKVRPHDFAFSEPEKARGEFLMCACAAVSDVVIEAQLAGVSDIPLQHIDAKVKTKQAVGDMLSLTLLTPRSQRLRFLAGQAIRLTARGVWGEFAIASCPCDERAVEVHVRRGTDGAFAELAFDTLKANDAVAIDGPSGDFVLKENALGPAVFLAWGRGFAPIKSLMQHAMAEEAASLIQLYWDAHDGVGQYQDNFCRAWHDALDNFYYFPLRDGQGTDFMRECVTDWYNGLEEVDIYAAGPADKLAEARERFLEAGLPAENWRQRVVEG